MFLVLHGLSLRSTSHLGLVGAQWISELFVVLQWYNGFWKLVQISPQDIGCVVYCVTCPVQSLAITLGRIEDVLKIFDTFGGTAQTKDTFNIRSF